ncbi:MAG TPA: hypothetical protein VFD65_06320 [Chitinophagales bacterium]|nr:hypothetical protein [Chitinophagales bacterium]
MFFLAGHDVYAQEKGIQWSQYNNIRENIFLADSSAILLDEYGVFPSTLILKVLDTDTVIPASDYYLDAFTGRLSITNSAWIGQELKAFYRRLPYNVQSVYQKKKFGGYSWMDTTFIHPYFYDPYYDQEENPFDFGGLDYSGAFARGISFGNSQDLVVNSTLDLQLSGKIGDIEILAALTDNTIPIQPDGSTQQINDFDKVYIQVSKGKHRLIAGDYGIQSRDEYFIRFDKQLQGASFQTGFDLKKGWQTDHSASFAVAKGKFARNKFNGIEANQGPYKLVGNNGEGYIIILAGSERIYADGRLLSRGENADYVIDYNTGELTFTPNFMITKDIRLVVEFEYSDKNYFRTLMHTSHQASYKGLKLYTQFYSEQDSKNKPILSDIDSTAESILRSIGNDIHKAIVPGARRTEYAANEIQYAKKDSLINGVLYKDVYYYTTQPDAELYSLRFSFVGEGIGNYKPDKNTLNQRVYVWVAPVNGVPQGAYEPVELIITPKKDQYLVLGAEYNIRDKSIIQTELAYSNRDPNTFSTIDNHENKGWALYNRFSRIDSIGKKDWVLSSKVMYELKSKSFQAPEQYRSVEFSRDWNLDDGQKAQEHFLSTLLELGSKKTGWKTAVGWNYFNRQDLFRGNQQMYKLGYNKNNWDVRLDVSWMNSKDSLYKTSFLRPTVHIGKSFKKMKGLSVSAGAYTEYNAIRNTESDTLFSTAYYNNNIYASIKTSDTLVMSGDITYKYRNDLTPDGDEFSSLSTGHDIEVRARANTLKNQNLSLSFIYRQLSIHDTLASSLESDKNFLGRAEYGFRVKRGAVRFNAIYELGSGQERVREFTYLEVASGQGVFRWIDQNGDGVQQLDEFVVAQYSDSVNYVRVLTNVNEYIQARTVTFNQVLQLNPKAVWYNETGIKKLISRFNLSSSIVITRKTFKGAKTSPFNPFILNTNDENVLNLNSSFRNSIYFNQGDSKFYMNYTWFLNQNKTLLVNGFDTRRKQEQTLESNLNISKGVSFNLKLMEGENYANAEYSENNNYKLKIYKVKPEISWVYKTSIRTSIGYEFDRKKNVPELGDELARGNKFNFDFRYSQASKQTIEAKFSFVLFDYNGALGTSKSYHILDGLQPGKNYIWNATYNRNLSNNLELSISYEGRKSGDKGKVIHLGNATLRAMF